VGDLTSGTAPIRFLAATCRQLFFEKPVLQVIRLSRSYRQVLASIFTTRTKRGQPMNNIQIQSSVFGVQSSWAGNPAVSVARRGFPLSAGRPDYR
jgi:hypothetical protein